MRIIKGRIYLSDEESSRVERLWGTELDCGHTVYPVVMTKSPSGRKVHACHGDRFYCHECGTTVYILGEGTMTQVAKKHKDEKNKEYDVD